MAPSQCQHGEWENVEDNATEQEEYLKQVHAQLLNAHLRLLGRWAAPEKNSLSAPSTCCAESLDSFSVSSRKEQADDSPDLSGSDKGGTLPHCATLNSQEPGNSEAGVRISVTSDSLPRKPGDMRKINVEWTESAKKLQTKDRQIVSPSFELFPGVFFRMMITPKLVGIKKGQACFKKARGRGAIFLKLLAPVDGSTLPLNLLFRISIGSGENKQPPRGPVQFDFGSNMCGLSTHDELWDFLSAVDAESPTFSVHLEVLAEAP